MAENETIYELRQRVARDAGLSSEAAAGWVGEVEDVVVAEALSHAERTRGIAGKRDVIRRLTEIGNREEPAAMRSRVARSLGFPLERLSEVSDRAETPDEVARGIANVLRRSGDREAATRAEYTVRSLEMDASMRSRIGQRGGSLSDVTSGEMDERIRSQIG